jgi:hypothetical protein
MSDQAPIETVPVNANLVRLIREACTRLNAYVADQFADEERGEPRDGYARYDEKMADLREEIADLAEGV